MKKKLGPGELSTSLRQISREKPKRKVKRSRKPVPGKGNKSQMYVTKALLEIG